MDPEKNIHQLILVPSLFINLVAALTVFWVWKAERKMSFQNGTLTKSPIGQSSIAQSTSIKTIFRFFGNRKPYRQKLSTLSTGLMPAAGGHTITKLSGLFYIFSIGFLTFERFSWHQQLLSFSLNRNSKFSQVRILEKVCSDETLTAVVRLVKAWDH